MINSTQEAQINTPIDLAALSFAGSTVLDEMDEPLGDIVLLRQSAVFWRGDNTRANPPLSKRASKTHSLISQLRADSAKETTVSNEWGDKRIFLGLPVDFSKLLPLTKSRLLSNSGNRDAEVDHSIVGDNVNILRSVGGCHLA